MNTSLPEDVHSDDLSFVHDPARIAIYDDLLSSPRIIDIEPNTTKEFIYSLATEIYNQARDAGGSIPYTVITQVVENYIHARFNEMVVSIFDGGNTIRFTDQGPGIKDKAKAQQPGYSSATREMKEYINGVGSGLPIVKEYLETKHGRIYLEDNLDSGAVVTITLKEESEIVNQEKNNNQRKENHPSTSFTQRPYSDQPSQIEEQARVSQEGHEQASSPQTYHNEEYLALLINRLPKRAYDVIPLFSTGDIWGVKDISSVADIPLSSTHALMKKLEESGIVRKFGKKWELTDLGKQIYKKIK